MSAKFSLLKTEKIPLRSKRTRSNNAWHNGISNYPQWRENFSGHVLGFGVRSERKRLEEADLARVKEILLDEASFAGEEKMCVGQGDCALLMRSPIGEVLVMFELWRREYQGSM